MIRSLFILIILCLPVAAQERVPITQDMPDVDQFIVLRNGKEYRALPPEKVAELAKQKLDLEAALKKIETRDAEIVVLNTQKELFIEKISLIEAQRDNARRDVQDARVLLGQTKQLLDEETALRREQGQFIPHSQKSGFWGHFFTFLDSPASQGTFKIALPLLQQWRCK